ncbi:hypothetical protein HOY80DRAFT_1072427 [Tuber brumale]|nr:hypothetical protein HOY80DRAFT_1072427 [Tuber brumale]
MTIKTSVDPGPPKPPGMRRSKSLSDSQELGKYTCAEEGLRVVDTNRDDANDRGEVSPCLNLAGGRTPILGEEETSSIHEDCETSLHCTGTKGPAANVFHSQPGAQEQATEIEPGNGNWKVAREAKSATKQSFLSLARLLIQSAAGTQRVG